MHTSTLITLSVEKSILLSLSLPTLSDVFCNVLGVTNDISKSLGVFQLNSILVPEKSMFNVSPCETLVLLPPSKV